MQSMTDDRRQTTDEMIGLEQTIASQESVLDLDLFVSSAPTREAEIFPGVMERRYFLRGSVATAAAVLALGVTPNSLLAQEPAKQTGAAEGNTLAWDTFLKESVPVAQHIIADPAFSVDEYLYRIASLAARLKELPNTKLYPFPGMDPRLLGAPSFRGSPFFIIQWRMEPGAVFPPHNHPNASVCTLVYEGEVRLRNFEVVGEAPEYTSKKTFHVRETHNGIIARGRINTLSPSRDNIHYFQVGKEGARGIDISTLHGKNEGFSFLDISATPADSEKRIFEATWNDLLVKAPPSKKS